jgi:hypothetical protein
VKNRTHQLALTATRTFLLINHEDLLFHLTFLSLCASYDIGIQPIAA